VGERRQGVVVVVVHGVIVQDVGPLLLLHLLVGEDHSPSDEKEDDDDLQDGAHDGSSEVRGCFSRLFDASKAENRMMHSVSRPRR